VFSRTFAPLTKMYTLKFVYIISVFIFHDVVWTNFLWNYCVLVQIDAHIILTYFTLSGSYKFWLVALLREFTTK